MKKVLPLVVLLTSGCLLVWAQEKPTADPGPRSLDDLLWLAKSPEDANLGSDLRALRERLAGSAVPSIAKAREVALKYKFEKCGGVRAEEGREVAGLLRMGVNLPGVAREGDLVWVVRFSDIRFGVTQEVWVGSSSGGAKCMLPFA